MNLGKKATFGLAVVIAAAAISLVMTGQFGNPVASPSPLRRIGTSWDPERLRNITTRAHSLFNIQEHVSTTIRMADPTQLSLLQQGKPAQSAGRIIKAAEGRTSFPADCTAWHEQGPCMVWQFGGVDLTRERDFGGFEVRIANRRGGDHKFYISFSVWSPDNVGAIPRTATVPLVPERTMNYVILPDMSAQPDNVGAVDAKTVTLVFPDLDRQKQIEVLSVRILSKIGGYTGAPLGNAYESLDEETRPVVYQWTDGEAAWSVSVPGVDPALRFGTGLLPNSPPIAFKVSVEWNGERREVFREKLDKGDAWVDRVVDLGPWKGREVQIIFSAESATSEVALWSSPRIIQTGRQGKLFFVYLIDALRPDFVGGIANFRGRRNFTPSFRRLAEGGVTFTNALANAPVTKYSVPALFSGLYPSHTGVMTYQRVPDDIETLAEIFRRSGFTTASFSLNGNSGRLRGLHQGFDHLFSMGRIQREARSLGGLNAAADYSLNLRAMTSAAIINDFLYGFIRAHREEDLFVYIHAMDTHSPYLPEGEFLTDFRRNMSEKGLEEPSDRSVLLEELRSWSTLPVSERLSEEALLELYRGTAETADKHLEEFCDFLKAEGMWERSTILLTADHGEHLNEHPEAGLFLHMHPMLLEVLRIPLIIVATADLPSGRQISTPVQLADIMPTLLDLAGIPYDAGSYDGVSLLLLMADKSDDYFYKRPIISQSHPFWSVFLRDIHSPDITQNWNVEVYNVDRDPREHVSLKGSRARRRLQELVESLSLVPRRAVPEAETIVNEEEVLRQLKALGYVQ